ncbi:hypothetical protein AUEXF2481DRAFT_25738 [Aureobasidium subglaciale EXF-2481]|uniref:Uncharacterized protein n=1 Tax=Aureobasidium subglaciale (strain EXF-2481) TaxID=1043005 RepID=A0A074Z0F8_AURSE|nr:uncharacterized protein AUEXF2481DRAFT_25738 [Aureobasidium subglaciale EXF-2481]KEQ99862.1 hypothetical protein AUEXF2481DRAFT_25738 [Aureobasidium subglaciale EXF-2481]
MREKLEGLVRDVDGIVLQASNTEMRVSAEGEERMVTAADDMEATHDTSTSDKATLHRTGTSGSSATSNPRTMAATVSDADETSTLSINAPSEIGTSHSSAASIPEGPSPVLQPQPRKPVERDSIGTPITRWRFWPPPDNPARYLDAFIQPHLEDPRFDTATMPHLKPSSFDSTRELPFDGSGPISGDLELQSRPYRTKRRILKPREGRARRIQMTSKPILTQELLREVEMNVDQQQQEPKSSTSKESHHQRPTRIQPHPKHACL